MSDPEWSKKTFHRAIPVPLPEGAETGDEIDEMFETAFSRSPDNEFLQSIHSWWEEKGFLTQKQYAALAKWSNEERTL